ncbi:RHS repeat-associated core domain-containing protein [Tenacibaculum maritimum]|nr:RHS repeat-associated core domain-containing protein [Tenacibaculum maritimum]
MYDEEGEQVWERSLDLNGKVINGSNAPCPFLYQGQYYDKEIELAYNRFRYYDPDDGRYISKDPIELASGENNFYSYVDDPNEEIDVFGLTSKTYSLTYNHKKKKNKITDEKELKKQVRGQVRAMNKIIKKEGIAGLKKRIKNYDKNLESEGRAHTKSLGSAGEGKAWLHEPDMRTGGLPTDVATKPGDRRNNSILGGQANKIAKDILNAPDTTTRITAVLNFL